MKKLSLIIVVLLIMVLVISGCDDNRNVYEVTEEEYEFLKRLSEEEYLRLNNFDLFLTVLNYLEENYYEDIDYDNADVAAAIALVNSLDRYSSLQLASAMVSKQTAGIGLSLDVTMFNEYRISYVHPNTPAAQPSDGGSYIMQRGDQIYAINGERVEGASFSYFSLLSVGGAGTQLILTIKRDDVILDEDFVAIKQELILKEAYYINNVPGLPSEVGYIKLLSFTGSAKDDFVDCITQFKNDGNEYLILDLRGNSGGSSSVMTEIANYLVNDEDGSDSIPLIELENREGDVQVYSTNSNLFIDVPIAVLVNGRTASAAEALTSAMVYHNTAVSIGEKTYGKGTALNQPAPILDKDNTPFFISIVVGKYYVFDEDHPDGKWCIEGIGFTPDIVVADRDFKLELSDDKDVIAALEFWQLIN